MHRSVTSHENTTTVVDVERGLEGSGRRTEASPSSSSSSSFSSDGSRRQPHLRCCAGVLSAIGTASNAVTSSFLSSFVFRLSSSSSSYCPSRAFLTRNRRAVPSTVCTPSHRRHLEERTRGSHVTDRDCPSLRLGILQDSRPPPCLGSVLSP